MKKIATLCLLVVIAVAVKAQHPCIVAEYPFSGNALDASGNGHDGIVNGATLITDKDGNSNSAYSFDGVDDYINCGPIFNTSAQTAITIAAWFNIKDLNSQLNEYTGIVLGRKVTGRVFLRITNDGERKFSAIIGDPTETDASSVASISSINFGQWYHVVGIYKDKDVKLYIDGVDQGNVVHAIDGVNLSELQAEADSLRIGLSYNSGNAERYVNGGLDEVNIYNCELTQAEIDSLYTVGVNEIAHNSNPLELYPNPTAGKFEVRSLELGVEKVEVYDLFGRLVLSSTTPQIDMRGFAKGMYYVKVGDAVRKLVIE